MNFIKKQRVGFYGLIATAILLLIGMIMFQIAFNSSEGFFAQQAPNAASNVILLVVFAIVCLAAAIVVAQFQKDGIVGKVLAIVSDLLRVVGLVLVGLAVVQTIGAYVYDMSIWLGSDLHNGDDGVIAAIQLALASSIVLGVGIVVGAIASCFGIKNEEKAAE